MNRRYYAEAGRLKQQIRDLEGVLDDVDAETDAPAPYPARPHALTLASGVYDPPQPRYRSMNRRPQKRPVSISPDDEAASRPAMVEEQPRLPNHELERSERRRRSSDRGARMSMELGTVA